MVDIRTVEVLVKDFKTTKKGRGDIIVLINTVFYIVLYDYFEN